MSEGESRFLRQVRALLRATIEGRVPFLAAMQNLSVDLREIRRHGLDVDAAFTSGSLRGVSTATPPESAPVRVRPTESERAFLEDVDALIDYSLRNGVSFWTVLSPLAHDVGGLASYGWSLEKAASDCFLPAATGWAKRNAEPAGQAEEVLE